MIQKINSSLVIVAMASLLLAGSAIAQTSTSNSSSEAGPGVVDPGHPRVNQVNRREGRQQQRIANGIKNGNLSPRQTANLERREAGLQHQERRDMARHNGHLTKVEQRQLNRRENRISKSIYHDKHSH